MKFTFADFLLIVGFLMLVVPIFLIHVMLGSLITGLILIFIALGIQKPNKPE